MFLIIKHIQIVCCISYTKGTTLKANHNNLVKVFIGIGCISYTKGTTLKANHNACQLTV